MYNYEIDIENDPDLQDLLEYFKVTLPFKRATSLTPLIRGFVDPDYPSEEFVYHGTRKSYWTNGYTNYLYSPFGLVTADPADTSGRHSCSIDFVIPQVIDCILFFSRCYQSYSDESLTVTYADGEVEVISRIYLNGRDQRQCDICYPQKKPIRNIKYDSSAGAWDDLAKALTLKLRTVYFLVKDKLPNWSE